MKSMTGFGRGESSNETLTVNVELASLNRKQAEIAINLPRSLSELEGELRKQILDQISRGRVTAQITVQRINDASNALTLDQQKILALEKEFQSLSTTLGRELTLTPSEILTIPGVLTSMEVEAEQALPLIKTSLSEALKNLIEMREREGADLQVDCETRLATAESLLTKITERAPIVLTQYRENLISKLQDINGLDEAIAQDERIIREIALYADRSDITEEITRFQSHLDKFRDYLQKNEPIGRSLDFLCQELNRELNTIGAKANDALLAQLVVEGKTEIEKIREQIQNAE